MMLAVKRAAKSRPGIAAALALTVLLAAGCGTSGPAAASAAQHSSGSVRVDARRLPHLGTVLVDSRGYALYMFVPDNQREVTCTGICAATWPPLKLAAGARLSAGAGIQSSLLGSDPDPGGGAVVTYDGWPLYTYTGDVQPGQATGQGIALNGGDWYLMQPSGKPLTGGLPL
jgi:predicted lipoprotein with Yx(FWY)xxD motif